MLSNSDIAKLVRDLMLEAFRLVDESCAIVRENCIEEETAAYTRATARVVGPIVMDVLEPLYERHPELKPSNWDE